jgi:hypothetical protein
LIPADSVGRVTHLSRSAEMLLLCQRDQEMEFVDHFRGGRARSEREA